MNIRTGLLKLVPEPMPDFNRAHLQEEKPWGTTTQATAGVASWDWTCLHPRQSLTDPQSSAPASNLPFIFPGCCPCRLSSTHLLPCRKLPALDLVSHPPALWGHPSYPMAVNASSCFCTASVWVQRQYIHCSCALHSSLCSENGKLGTPMERTRAEPQ